MSRQKFEKTFNTFTKGLMTEASELNFPEDFSLYEKNFLLHRDGGRDRRKGMELVYPLGLTLTSTLYPLEFEDGIAPNMVEPSAALRTVLKNFYTDDSLGVGLLAPVVSRRSAARVYSHDDNMAVGLLAPVVYRRNPPEYRNAEPEAIGVGLLEPTVSRHTYPVYSTEEESISVGLLAPTIKRTNT